MTGLYVASNPTSLGAQFNLTRTMGELGDVLTRLSTGLRINSGKDDPAGLIASELLKSDITGTTKAITNTQRANSLIATADSSLGQVSSLLNDIKGLVVEAANTGAMSDAQIAANQLQIDASLESIDRIARTATYAGQKLLDGSLDFSTDDCYGSGYSDLQIQQANFGTANGIGVNVAVQQAAERGQLIYQGTGVDQTTTLDVTGSTGTKSFTFGAGTTNDAIAQAINAASDSTGVSAYVEGQAARGSVILSSTGANNDIVITANNVGLDAGNYSFRITKGATNDARIVSEAAGGNPGVVEIQLKESYQKTYNNFAGLFDVTVDTTDRVDADGASLAGDASTSVSMTRGDKNSVVYHDTDSSSVAITNGKSITVAGGDNIENGHISQLNGWTVAVDDAAVSAEGNWIVDDASKTIYIHSDSDGTAGLTADMLNDALSSSIDSVDAIAIDEVTIGGLLTSEGFKNGERYKFAGGADAGEVEITYKEGAKVDDILKQLNSAPNVSASLVQGADGNALIPALPNGKTYLVTTGAEDTQSDTSNDVNTVSKYASGATAQDVINLINSKLGDTFTAAAMNGDSAGGKVNYMDGAADWGSVNLDNALRFTGMDDGPLVRLTNLGTNGLPVANQQLGVKVIHPSEDDIKAGIHTPILEIRLATDASGNSITTAKDIADLFDKLTPEQTLGVSAEVLYPPGVDPNGRIFGVDDCGNPYTIDNCPADYGYGIVQPTNAPGVCGPNQGDLALLGTNQNIESDYAVARVPAGGAFADVAPTPAASGSGDGYDGTAIVTTDVGTSALNGLSFAFTRDEKLEGFDETTGTLTTYLAPEIDGTDTDGSPTDGDLLNAALNGAIAANWESIRAFTHATGDAVTVTVDDGDAANAVADANTGAKTKIGVNNAADAQVGTLGVGASDPALLIKANTKGTDMAGIKIHFINDPSSGLTQYGNSDDPATPAAPTTTPTGVLPDLKVELHTNEDGSRELYVTGNIETATALGTVNALDLANALNANSEFKKYFTAEAPLVTYEADDTDKATVGAVTFNNDVTKPQAETVGGYRVNSPANSDTNQTGTSSGIGMTGQSDANERLVLTANDVGSSNFVKVSTAQGSFATYDPWGNQTCEASGSDVVATINGNKTTATGNTISINSPDLALSMTLNEGSGGTYFNITGGGATFQLGPNVVSAQQMRLGIPSVTTTHLGGASGKLFQLKSGGDADLSSDAHLKLADKIVNEAISSIATTRGRLGAIQKSSLEPNILALQDSLTTLTEAESMISNADFAQESSNLTRLQLLMQAGAQALGLAGQLPQYAAQLVG
ncbi:MAG: hypothetical protein LBN39_03680 [Planctomycetaceae bacterium]|jgi:flagellin-like hook-associated protein FlgL|nr:hypothetical protein [Planctomycetaceae bacterium]